MAFQFVLSCGLVIAALIFQGQLHFLQSKDLGIDKDQVTIIQVPRRVGIRLDALKGDLLGKRGILSVSATDFQINAEQTSNQGFDWEGKAPDADGQVRWIASDANLASALGLEIVEGRDFRPGDETAGDRAFMINEAAARRFG